MLQRVLSGLILLVMLCGCETPSSPSHATPPSSITEVAPPKEQYRIGPGDQLQISVWQHPDLSGALVVLPDGQISVPLIGEVRASGKTVKELGEEIRVLLSEYVRGPEVTVTVVNPESANFQQRIRVTGAVRTPTSVPFRKGMTVLDVVLEAGGPNEFASGNASKLYRSGPSGTQTMDIHLDDILKKGKMGTNYELQPSDVITVPERLF